MELEQARQLARTLMDEHGLSKWTFAFDNAYKRVGNCHRGKITLSRHFVLINEPERIRLVVLHEIAHALVGLEHGHDEVWKQKCLEIGGDGQRLVNLNIPQAGKYCAACPNCKGSHYLVRTPKSLYNWYCKACGPEKGLLVWKEREHATLGPAVST